MPPGALVDFETDSLSSTFTLVDEIARTSEGQIAESHLLASPEFRDLRGRGSGAHIYGESNPCADRASRNKITELRELCTQLGVRAVSVEPAWAAIRIYHDVLRHAALEAGREIDYLAYAETLDPRALPPPAPAMFSLPEGCGERPLLADPTLAAAADQPLPQETIKFMGRPRSALARALEKGEARRTAKQQATGGAPKHGLARALAQAAVTSRVRKTSSLQGKYIPRSALAKALLRAEGTGTPMPRLAQVESAAVPAPDAAPLSKTRRRELKMLRHAVANLSPNVCSSATNAETAPAEQRKWTGPFGVKFGQRKPRKLPAGWVTLATLRKRTGRVGFAPVALQEDSPLALRTADPAEMVRLDGELQDVLDAAPNHRSLPKDEASWNKYWEPITAFFNTSAVRAPPAGAAHFTEPEVRNELKLLCWALILIMGVMKPRAKTAKAAKPQSGYGVLSSVRRMHNRLGLLMVPFTLLSQVMRGLKQRFVERHGHEALLVQRKYPLFYVHLVGLLAVVSVLLPGNYLWEADSLLGCSTLAMVSLCYSSGFRKAEITTFDARSTPLTFGSLVWHLNGVDYSDLPPSNLLRHPTYFDYVSVYPRQSKCDYTGEIWGDKPSYHHYSTTVGNAFVALARLELRAQVAGGEARRVTPLFIDNNRRPVSPSFANLILDAMLLTFLAPLIAYRYTWHSFRIGLATRLHRAHVSDSDIQAICRWQSADSLKIYIKMTAEDYLEKLTKAHRQQGELGALPSCRIDSSDSNGQHAFGAATTDGPSTNVASRGVRHALPPVQQRKKRGASVGGVSQPLPSADTEEVEAPPTETPPRGRQTPVMHSPSESMGSQPPVARHGASAQPPPMLNPPVERPEQSSSESTTSGEDSDSGADDAATAAEPRPAVQNLLVPETPTKQVQPRLPPGWSERKHTHNLRTGEPLAGRGFSMYVSPNGTQYRTIAASWQTFQLREQQPDANDHQVLRAMGEDPNRCLLQQVIGDVTNLRAEEAQYAQWLTNRRRADAVALAEHISEMAAIEAACAGLEPSETLAEAGETRAMFGPHMRPTGKQRTEVVRGPRRARPGFTTNHGSRNPGSGSRAGIQAPVRRPILVLAGVQLSNYRCLPALRKPTGSEIAPMERSDPTSR